MVESKTPIRCAKNDVMCFFQRCLYYRHLDFCVCVIETTQWVQIFAYKACEFELTLSVFVFASKFEKTDVVCWSLKFIESNKIRFVRPNSASEWYCVKSKRGLLANNFNCISDMFLEDINWEQPILCTDRDLRQMWLEKHQKYV